MGFFPSFRRYSSPLALILAIYAAQSLNAPHASAITCGGLFESLSRKIASYVYEVPKGYRQELNRLLPEAELAKYPPAVLEGAFKRVQAAENPYSTLANLPGSPVLESLEFQNLAYRVSHGDRAAFKDVSDWVKSDEHALYAYQELGAFGSESPELLDFLIRENRYFAKAGRVRGPPYTLVTYSFEKETHNPAVTLYFKPPGYGDEAWINLPEEERIRILKEIPKKAKKVLPASEIAPTELKPGYLNGYMEEINDTAEVGNQHGANAPFTWEVTHRSFEFNRSRHFANMADIASQLKETHSFHSHVVFDLPKKYEHTDDFVRWLKQAEDYVYLSGLEEGIHGNDLVFLPELQSELPKPDAQFHNHYTLPTNLDRVNAIDHKFFGIGVRSEIYGTPPTGFKRIGLELRDVSRKMDKWESYLNQIGSAAEQRIWEQKIPRESRPTQPRLRVARNAEFDALEKLGIDTKYAQELIRAEPTVLIPLQEFEKAPYWDYRAQHPRSATPEQAARISAAREKYKEELLKTFRNMKKLTENKEGYEREDITMAVRMDLSSWAKQARVSELFSGI